MKTNDRNGANGNRSESGVHESPLSGNGSGSKADGAPVNGKVNGSGGENGSPHPKICIGLVNGKHWTRSPREVLCCTLFDAGILLAERVESVPSSDSVQDVLDLDSKLTAWMVNHKLSKKPDVVNGAYYDRIGRSLIGCEQVNSAVFEKFTTIVAEHFPQTPTDVGTWEI